MSTVLFDIGSVGITPYRFWLFGAVLTFFICGFILDQPLTREEREKLTEPPKPRLPEGIGGAIFLSVIWPLFWFEILARGTGRLVSRMTRPRDKEE